LIEKTKSGDRQYLLLGGAEKMLNKVLSLDEETLASLATLAGSVIEIDVLNTEFRMFILPSEKGITLETEYEGKAGVTIKGTPPALLEMITTAKFGAGDVEISGNVGLAQKLQSIFRGMEIDWEEYLSHFVGDIAAHKLGNFLKGMNRFVIASGKTIGMDISEYLRFEKEALLDKTEVDEFNQAVDVLRNDVERLQKRLERLEKVSI
jgi:ubiquinone biosynthesis protein UbiJ